MRLRSVIGLGLCLLAAIACGAPRVLDVGERARVLHEAALVVDGHNDIATWILVADFDLGMDGAADGGRSTETEWIFGSMLSPVDSDALRTHTDLARWRNGGLDVQFLSIFPDPERGEGVEGWADHCHAMIDAVEAQVARYQDRLALVTHPEEIEATAAAGQVALVLSLEGGHAIGDDLDRLRAFHARGVRLMTLSWSRTHEWADAVDDRPRHGGLSDFGRDVVAEMNRLGIIVDVSHASDDTFRDALAFSRAPVLASHSSARALVGNPRNLSDEMLVALAENGGVAMVNFGGSFVDPRKRSTGWMVFDLLTHFGPSAVPIGRVLDQIDHIVEVSGIDHVGLGADYDGTVFMPVGLEDVSGYPRITQGLLDRGYSESEIRKILGGNAMRVWRGVAEVAQAGDVAAPSR